MIRSVPDHGADVSYVIHALAERIRHPETTFSSLLIFTQHQQTLTPTANFKSRPHSKSFTDSHTNHITMHQRLGQHLASTAPNSTEIGVRSLRTWSNDGRHFRAKKRHCNEKYRWRKQPKKRPPTTEFQGPFDESILSSTLDRTANLNRPGDFDQSLQTRQFAVSIHRKSYGCLSDLAIRISHLEVNQLFCSTKHRKRSKQKILTRRRICWYLTNHRIDDFATDQIMDGPELNLRRRWVTNMDDPCQNKVSRRHSIGDKNSSPDLLLDRIMRGFGTLW